MDGAVEQFQEVLLLQRLEHIELTAREQRTDHFKRGILGSGTDECDDALLYGTQERILLRLGETVNLVNK